MDYQMTFSLSKPDLEPLLDISVGQWSHQKLIEYIGLPNKILMLYKSNLDYYWWWIKSNKICLIQRFLFQVIVVKISIKISYFHELD